MAAVLQERSLSTIGDISRDEILWILQKTRELKEARERGDEKTLKKFRIDNPFFGVYEVFLENSTRTRESFDNAAAFHGVKHTPFNVASSSFNKNESYADTFAMLTGYDNEIFVVRTALEGVCRWLDISGSAYMKRHGLTRKPAFLNAGDGSHEHPTQELLDEFTFLEELGWDTSRIHIAFIGDLLNGRTVHSKVDGLRIFGNVEVDLVAPSDLAMPEHYVQRMEQHGFTVNRFGSLQEYLAQERVARIQYYVRDQLERMPAALQEKVEQLRMMTKLKMEDVPLLPKDTRLFHPLPMNKSWPEIPSALKNTSFNGWERQSHNGYLMRIVLLAAVAGIIGEDFSGKKKTNRNRDYGFIKEITATEKMKDTAAGDIKPIENGIVIDHLFRGEDMHIITEHINRIVRIMGYDKRKHFSGPTIGKQSGKSKGYIMIPGHEPVDKTSSEVHKLAALSPGATVNVIRNSTVIRKFRIDKPPTIFGYDEVSCRNERCITHPKHEEGIPALYRRFDLHGDIYTCHFCDTPHTYFQLWESESLRK